jgi:hypothetical protein
VTAACKQAEKRRLDGFVAEVERRDVAVEMVDRHERKAARPRERLRRGEPHEQRADEPGSLRDGHGLEVVEACLGLREGLLHHRRDELEVPPRRDLGDDAAVTGMQLCLRGDDARTDLALDGHERCGGLVAGRLDPHDHVDSITPPRRARPLWGRAT